MRERDSERERERDATSGERERAERERELRGAERVRDERRPFVVAGVHASRNDQTQN